MNEQQWLNEYNPIEFGTDGILWDNDHPILKLVPANHIWTLLDEGGETWISAGAHFVNRLGYYITEKPWTDPDMTIELESENEDEEEDHCDDRQR